MVKVDKDNALFLKGVVIANGIPDSDGDVLNKKEIKQLISSFLSHQTDTNHDFLQNMGVKIIENYISQTEEIISGHKIPSGSWLASLMVWDKEIMSLIRQNRLNGLSLASQPDKDAIKDISTILNKRKTYAQFKDKDKLTPTFISIVEKPSNKIPFEYFSYQTYITKSKKSEEDSVSEETKELSKIATSLIEVLGSQLTSNVDATQPIVKAAPPQGGVAPTMQPQAQPYAPTPQPAVEPASLQSIDAKLDKLIQIMSGAGQVQKAEDNTKKKKVNGDGTSARTSGHGERTPTSTPKVEEETVDEEEEVETEETNLVDGANGEESPKAGEGGDSVSKEQKTNDETGQPQTKEGGASLNQVKPTPNNNVQPSNKLQGQTGGRTVVKSAPAQTQNSTISQPVVQNYNTQQIGTMRDPLGRPIRD